MRYIDYTEKGELQLNECQAPAMEDGDVLVKVHGFGINRADLLQVQGKYPPPRGASDILGMEVAGTVEAVAGGVSGALVGQRVCAMITGGGYAEYVVVPVDHLMFMPDTMGFIEAAAIPEVHLTAFQVLHNIANVQDGQRVLVHAGASGLGSALVQMAKKVGAKVAVTSSTSEKLQYCSALGADLAINYRSSSFKEQLKAQGFAPDLIVDIVGGDYTNDNLSLLAQDGLIVQLAILNGRWVNQFDMAKVLAKRARIQGTTLRNRSDAYKAQLVTQFVARYWPMFATDELSACVDKVFDVSNVLQAHLYMAQNRNLGKIVVDARTWCA